MRVLVDVSHPALAHVFGHVIPALRARGHETLVVARDKDVTLSLLDSYGIAHRVLAPAAVVPRLASGQADRAYSSARPWAFRPKACCWSSATMEGPNPY